MYNRLLNSQTKTINSAALILAVMSFISGVLGLLRDRLLAGTFGAGNELDIYYAAFRIPDFISIALIMGSISAAIIPIFSSYLVRSKQEAWKFFANLINLFLFFLIIISIILIIFVPKIMSLIVPGFSEEKKEMTIILTRIMFLSPIFLGLSNVISGILRVFKRFFITALAPIMYNLGIIFGILFFVPFFGITGLAWGVVFGAFLHFLIQIPILFKLGFRPKPIFNLFDLGFIKTIKLTLPRALGLVAGQINLIIITAIGSSLAAGSVAVFNLASNLYNLPIIFIANSFSIAAFPFLALYFANKEKERFIKEFSSIFKQIIFLVVPISVLMFVLRAQIVRIILGIGKFDWTDTCLTAACLGIFSFAILASGLVLLISSTFYASYNTKIPALITLITVGLNIAFCYLFIYLLSFENLFQKFLLDFFDLNGVKNSSIIALPLAITISGIFQLFLLLIFLYKQIGDFKIKEIIYFFFRTLFSSFFLGLTCYLTYQITSSFIDTRFFWAVFFQTFLATLGGISVFVVLSFLLKSCEINKIKFLICKKNGNEN